MLCYLLPKNVFLTRSVIDSSTLVITRDENHFVVLDLKIIAVEAVRYLCTNVFNMQHNSAQNKIFRKNSTFTY